MLARLWMKWLGLGILSTVTGCAVAPPADVPPVVTPLPYAHWPSTTGNSRSDIYQPSPYEHKMDREELDIADGAVLKSRNRSRAIGSGNRNAHASAIHAGSGDLRLASGMRLSCAYIVSEVLAMQAKIKRHILGWAFGASLVVTSCQTVQTTRGGVVGVDRPQQMSVFTPSAAEVAATAGSSTCR